VEESTTEQGAQKKHMLLLRELPEATEGHGEKQRRHVLGEIIAEEGEAFNNKIAKHLTVWHVYHARDDVIGFQDDCDGERIGWDPIGKKGAGIGVFKFRDPEIGKEDDGVDAQCFFAHRTPSETAFSGLPYHHKRMAFSLNNLKGHDAKHHEGIIGGYGIEGPAPGKGNKWAQMLSVHAREADDAKHHEGIMGEHEGIMGEHGIGDPAPVAKKTWTEKLKHLGKMAMHPGNVFKKLDDVLEADEAEKWPAKKEFNLFARLHVVMTRVIGDAFETDWQRYQSQKSVCTSEEPEVNIKEDVDYVEKNTLVTRGFGPEQEREKKELMEHICSPDNMGLRPLKQ